MNTSFGPWTTTMVRGSRTQLSTFWRQRMALLPAVRAARTPQSAAAIFALFVGVVALGVWPMFRAMPVLAEAPPAEKNAENQGAKPKAESPPAGAATRDGARGSNEITPAKNPFPYRFESLSDEKDLAASVFKFRLHVPKGVRFGIQLEGRDADEHHGGGGGTHFESETDEPLVMTIKFTRRDGKSGSAVISKDELVDYAIDCPKAYPYGISSIINMPFVNTDPADLKLEMPASATDWGGQSEFVRRVVLVYAKSARKEDFKESRPRFEIGLHVVNKEERKASIAKEEPLARLEHLWRGNERRIGSVALRCRHISNGASGLRGLSRAEFDAALADLDLAARPDDLIQFCDRVRSQRLDGLPWGITEFSCLGPKFRETTSDATGKLREVRVSDGDLDVIYSLDNSQADAWLPGDSVRGHTSIADFVSFPELLGRKSSLVVEEANGKLNIHGEAFNMEVDASTGFIRRSLSQHGDDANESLYFGCDLYPGGVFFPRAVVGAHFSKDRLSNLQVMVIEKAGLNESLPQDTFRLSVPAKTRVWDHRHDTFRSHFLGVTTEANTDLAKFLAAKDAAKAAPTREGK
jgi:hypothetical protein